jgi:hypothetical protein
MRITKLALYLATALAINSLALAQLPPQDGTFVKICSIHGEANQGQPAWNQDSTCNLPNLFPLDRSYHQQSARFAGGNPESASSRLQINEIPAGIHLDVSGNYYWSMERPMRIVVLDTDDPSTNFIRQFQVHTYCGPAAWPGPGCSIHVDVYARRKQ